jgi:hypothetical protein
MRSHLAGAVIVPLALMLAAHGSLVCLAQTNVPSANRGGSVDFNAFKVVTEKNIFDPNRGPKRSSNGVRPKPKTVESIALVGIMSYEKGLVAFFNGTSSLYRKALKTADSIAGFKVVSITVNSVKLGSDNNELELTVGSQLRREDEGEWQLAGKAERLAASSAPAPSPGSTPSQPPAASSGDSASSDEVLKRLMQRREQE